MGSFVRFMSSAAGRAIRILAGIGLIAWGFSGVSGDNGYLIVGIGAIPLLTGTLGICLFAPLLGHPLKGSRVRTSNG